MTRIIYYQDETEAETPNQRENRVGSHKLSLCGVVMAAKE
jgi:hypothetical protein